jgi:hypothetical protein
LGNPFADYSPAPFPPTYCQGGTQSYTPVPPYDQLYSPPYAPAGSIPISCYFNSFGNKVVNNSFLNNGFFGNDTNGDLANAALPYSLNNCFWNNFDLRTGTPSSAPTKLPTACGAPWNPDTQQEYSLTLQLGCDSLGPASGACTGLTGSGYPLPTKVQLLPVPHLAGMSNPWAGVPKNSWCQ